MKPVQYPFVQNSPGSTTQTIHFWDRSKHRAWLLSQEIASRLPTESAIIPALKAVIDEWRSTGRYAKAVSEWERLFSLDVHAFQINLTAITPDGEFLRDTMPPHSLLDHDVLVAVSQRRATQAANGEIVYGSL